MDETGIALVIGNKNYSSWSLRPWLAMKAFGVAFGEINVDIYGPGARERILAHSPSGLVPALKMSGRVIWDTLAILETLAERHADKPFWPADAETRALARSVCAEMHSGFSALRREMPMDLLHDKPASGIGEEVARDIRRIVRIWTECRAAHGAGGPYLFGAFCIADAMYAPVASRFRTYHIDLAAFGDDGAAEDYVETIFAMPELGEWSEGAALELAGGGAG